MTELGIVGLDLSLTSTGVAVIDGGGTRVWRIQPRSTGHERLRAIWQEVAAIAICEEDWRCIVAVEGPSFGSPMKQHEMGGLWWHVTYGLWAAEVPVVVIPPSNVKKYATGAGNGKKDAVLAAVVRRYPDVEVTGNDEADALVLAAMTADQLGRPIAAVPQAQRAALAAVRWPEVS